MSELSTPHAELTRDEFEEVLGAMARAGLVRLARDAVFEKQGRRKSIPYRKVSLTRAALTFDETTPLVMKDAAAPPLTPTRRKRKKGYRANRQSSPVGRLHATGQGARSPHPHRPNASPTPDSRSRYAPGVWPKPNARESRPFAS